MLTEKEVIKIQLSLAPISYYGNVTLMGGGELKAENFVALFLYAEREGIKLTIGQVVNDIGICKTTARKYLKIINDPKEEEFFSYCIKYIKPQIYYDGVG